MGYLIYFVIQGLESILKEVGVGVGGVEVFIDFVESGSVFLFEEIFVGFFGFFGGYQGNLKSDREKSKKTPKNI